MHPHKSKTHFWVNKSAILLLLVFIWRHPNNSWYHLNLLARGKNTCDHLIVCILIYYYVECARSNKFTMSCLSRKRQLDFFILTFERYKIKIKSLFMLWTILIISNGIRGFYFLTFEDFTTLFALSWNKICACSMRFNFIG